MKKELNTLANGIKYLQVHKPGSLCSSIQVWFRAGSSLESNENKGIAHFLEHMFFKGTKKYPGLKLAKAIEDLGGEFNAFTSFDYTCYYINVPNEALLKGALPLLDMISDPMFLKKDLGAEVEVVLEEYKRAVDSPGQYQFFQIQDKFFQAPYRHPILGTKNSISNFTISQVKAFRNKHYSKANCLIIVGGDLDQDNLGEKVRKKVENLKMPKGEPSSFKTFKMNKSNNKEIHLKDVNLTRLTITLPSSPFGTKQSAAEELALNYIGLGESSPLYNRLVYETNLCQSLSSSTLHFSKGGFHSIKFSLTENKSEDFCKDLEALLAKLVICDEFDNDRLTRIKNQYMASKLYNQETLDQYLFSLGHGFAQNGDINCEEDFIETIKNLNKEDVIHGLRSIFSNSAKCSIQGSLDSEKTSLDNLAASALSLMEKIQNSAMKLSKQKEKSGAVKRVVSKYDKQSCFLDIDEDIVLYHRHNVASPTFNLSAFFDGGLSKENDKTNGIFYLLNSIWQKGSSKFPYPELQSFLEMRASSLHGFSGKNTIGLSLQGLSEHFSELQEVFVDTVFNPEFNDKVFDNEKQYIENEIKSSSLDPVKLLFRKANEVFFKGHPYSRPLIGSEKTVGPLGIEDVKSLHRDLINSSRVVFSYSGPKEVEEVYNIISSFELEKRKQSKRLDFVNFTPKAQEHSIPLDREQTHIFIGTNAFPPGSIQDIYLKILNLYLSGQSSSLFYTVRDQLGLCYTAQPVYINALEGSYWGIYIGTSLEKKKIATETILELLRKLGEKGVSSKEFNSLKTISKGQNTLSVQTNEDYVNLFSIPLLQSRDFDDFFTTQKKVQKANVEGFNKFMKNFLRSNFSMISSGAN